MRALLLALAITSCAEFVPEDLKVEVIEGYEVEHQTTAMYFFQGLFEDAFDVDLGTVIPHTKVYWADTRCDGDYGITWNGECYRGIMWACGKMVIALSQVEPGKVCGSSLLHELNHCLSVRAWGYYDGEHLGASWEVVDDANAFACKEGW